MGISLLPRKRRWRSAGSATYYRILQSSAKSRKPAAKTATKLCRC